ncbi:MAG TPA: orotate phosphoribosyltransferase [Stellaceae bacterium]|nr:orotate phosphoribosyltransferase [Stellaceae bacterium]
MTDKKQRLRDIIAAKSLLSGQFTLASGKPSGFFFDMKKTMFDPEGASLVGELIYDLVAGDADCKAIGGLELGAVPIAVAVAMKSAGTQRPIDAFFVRKEAKDHGTAKLIDGNFTPGSTVIVLEDVTTTGGSAMKAVKAVRAQGGIVAKIVTIVDRLEGARENLKKEGLELVSLFTNDDFRR